MDVIEVIEFESTLSGELAIPVPPGVTLPKGKVHVQVRPLPERRISSEDIARRREWMLKLAREAEEADVDLPADLAANHDYYAHGKRLP